MKEDEAATGTCLCSGAYSFDQKRARCFPTNDPDHSNKRPDHIRLEPRDGYRVEKEKNEIKEPGIVVLEKNLADIYSRARNRSRSKLDDLLGSGEAKVLGPISIAVAALLIVGICVCFWSARTPSLREDAYTVDQPDESTYRSAKTLEDGLSVTQGVIISPHPAYEANDADFPCGLSPPAVARGGGHDNGGFQHHFDNLDALSGHLTTQTEVCETSHAEYLSRVVTEEETLRRQARKQEEEKRRNEEEVGEAGAVYDSNIKMIFKHSQVK